MSAGSKRKSRRRVGSLIGTTALASAIVVVSISVIKELWDKEIPGHLAAPLTTIVTVVIVALKAAFIS